MGARTKHDITFQVGRNNTLAAGNLIGDMALSAQLDTLARGKAGTYDLAAGEMGVVVDFGDVAVARLVYIEADGEIGVTPGAPGPATAAIASGAAGSFPTGFTGGETLDIDIDKLGTVFTIFTTGASQAQDVANEINAAFALAGILFGGQAVSPATVVGGELRFTSPSVGELSEVDIKTGGTALATLGLTAAVTNGVNAIAGQTPLQLFRPANTSVAALSDGVKSFMLASLRTTSLTIDNLSSTVAVTVDIVIAGDVLAEPPDNC